MLIPFYVKKTFYLPCLDILYNCFEYFPELDEDIDEMFLILLRKLEKL